MHWYSAHHTAATYSAFTCTRVQIFVIDSSDRRRMEETGIELQNLLEEVRDTCHAVSWISNQLMRALALVG